VNRNSPSNPPVLSSRDCSLLRPTGQSLRVVDDCTIQRGEGGRTGSSRCLRWVLWNKKPHVHTHTHTHTHTWERLIRPRNVIEQ
jgi:hypothetical protein